MTRRVHHLTNTRKQMPDKYCSCSIYSSSPPPTTRNPPMADYNATATPTPADTPATRRRPRLQRRHRRARAAGRALHRLPPLQHPHRPPAHLPLQRPGRFLAVTDGYVYDPHHPSINSSPFLPCFDKYQRYVFRLTPIVPNDGW